MANPDLPDPVPIVSVEQFSTAFLEQVVTFPGSTADRPVWVALDGMLYLPAGFTRDEYGAIVIHVDPQPTAVFTRPKGPIT